jgi:hypothetical protein
MRRIGLAVVLVLSGVAPLVAGAQQPAKIARLGYLGLGSPAGAATLVRVEALRAGLRDLGYVEGKNLVIEFRWSDTVEQLHEAAAELVRMKVDVIFSNSSPRPRSPGGQPIRSPSSSRRILTPSALAMWRVLHAPAATSRGCRPSGRS